MDGNRERDVTGLWGTTETRKPGVRGTDTPVSVGHEGGKDCYTLPATVTKPHYETTTGLTAEPRDLVCGGGRDYNRDSRRWNRTEG